MLDRVDSIAAEVKQRQDARFARPVPEALVEPGDLLAGVAAGGRQEAHLRRRLTGELEYEPVEREVAFAQPGSATYYALGLYFLERR